MSKIEKLENIKHSYQNRNLKNLQIDISKIFRFLNLNFESEFHNLFRKCLEEIDPRKYWHAIKLTFGLAFSMVAEFLRTLFSSWWTLGGQIRKASSKCQKALIKNNFPKTLDSTYWSFDLMVSQGNILSFQHVIIFRTRTLKIKDFQVNSSIFANCFSLVRTKLIVFTHNLTFFQLFWFFYGSSHSYDFKLHTLLTNAALDFFFYVDELVVCFALRPFSVSEKADHFY